jgi:hypothetical protein
MTYFPLNMSSKTYPAQESRIGDWKILIANVTARRYLNISLRNGNPKLFFPFFCFLIPSNLSRKILRQVFILAREYAISDFFGSYDCAF